MVDNISQYQRERQIEKPFVRIAGHERTCQRRGLCLQHVAVGRHRIPAQDIWRLADLTQGAATVEEFDLGDVIPVGRSQDDAAGRCQHAACCAQAHGYA